MGIAPGKQLSDETTPFDHWDAPDYVRTKYLSQEEARGFAANIVVDGDLNWQIDGFGKDPFGGHKRC
jgi:hypothetical protein